MTSSGVDAAVKVGWAQHKIAPYCKGERCRMCGQKAAHKVGEESGPPWFHNLTAYLCCACFWVVFGDAHDSYPYDMPNPLEEIPHVEGQQPPAVDEQLRDPGVDS